MGEQQPQELRPEVIAQLTGVPRIAGDRLDAVLDANPAELAVAARTLQDRSVELLREAGVLPPQARTVLDLRWRQAAAVAAVAGTLGLWQLPAYAERRLSDMLKIVNPREAAWCIRALQWGELLAPDPPPPEGP